ncbi:hypothetical protein [Altererythrobacter fulvus]|uniref:hypothetical protein n=1 Tax=Caenibius fulvus TaxID=2126012 RepID=UPI0030197021
MNANPLPKWLTRLVEHLPLNPAGHSLLRKPVWRFAALALAVLIFAGGAWWSFSGLAISPSDLRPGPLAILALLMIPSLLYGGLGLVLLARSSGFSMPLGKATVIGAYAYLAEMLPLPGGAIVRAGALVKEGAGVKRSSALVILTAILWVSLGMLGAGIALWHQGLQLALPLLLAGLAFVLAITTWLWASAGPALAIQTLLHRMAGIALIAVRLQFAFAALHAPAALSAMFPFVLASLLGSASSIAPAGLGISESLAALVATTVEFSPGTAFLAVGIDRLFSLLACACTALIPHLRLRARPALGGNATSKTPGNLR